jgi:hypothetical protein
MNVVGVSGGVDFESSDITIGRMESWNEVIRIDSGDVRGQVEPGDDVSISLGGSEEKMNEHGGQAAIQVEGRANVLRK